MASSIKSSGMIVMISLNSALRLQVLHFDSEREMAERELHIDLFCEYEAFCSKLPDDFEVVIREGTKRVEGFLTKTIFLVVSWSRKGMKISKTIVLETDTQEITN